MRVFWPARFANIGYLVLVGVAYGCDGSLIELIEPGRTSKRSISHSHERGAIYGGNSVATELGYYYLEMEIY